MILGGIIAAALQATAAFVGLSQATAPQECRARPGAPKLDHVIIAVRHLDSLAARFSALGFRLKNGRSHPLCLGVTAGLAPVVWSGSPAWVGVLSGVSAGLLGIAMIWMSKRQGIPQ